MSKHHRSRNNQNNNNNNSNGNNNNGNGNNGNNYNGNNNNDNGNNNNGNNNQNNNVNGNPLAQLLGGNTASPLLGLITSFLGVGGGNSGSGGGNNMIEGLLSGLGGKDNNILGSLLGGLGGQDNNVLGNLLGNLGGQDNILSNLMGNLSGQGSNMQGNNMGNNMQGNNMQNNNTQSNNTQGNVKATSNAVKNNTKNSESKVNTVKADVSDNNFGEDDDIVSSSQNDVFSNIFAGVGSIDLSQISDMLSGIDLSNMNFGDIINSMSNNDSFEDDNIIQNNDVEFKHTTSKDNTHNILQDLEDEDKGQLIYILAHLVDEKKLDTLNKIVEENYSARH